MQLRIFFTRSSRMKMNVNSFSSVPNVIVLWNVLQKLEDSSQQTPSLLSTVPTDNPSLAVQVLGSWYYNTANLGMSWEENSIA